MCRPSMFQCEQLEISNTSDSLSACMIRACRSFSARTVMGRPAWPFLALEAQSMLTLVVQVPSLTTRVSPGVNCATAKAHVCHGATEVPGLESEPPGEMK